jgi:Flp pilus assembly protein TadD
MPEHPYYEELAGVYHTAGSSRERDDAVSMVLSEFAAHEATGWNVDHEYAMFCLDFGINLEEAFTRAERDFSRRPGNIDALEAYAWALHRTGRTEEAAQFIQEALRLQTKRPSLLYRAGMIAVAKGDALQGERLMLASAPVVRFERLSLAAGS